MKGRTVATLPVSSFSSSACLELAEAALGDDLTDETGELLSWITIHAQQGC